MSAQCCGHPRDLLQYPVLVRNFAGARKVEQHEFFGNADQRALLKRGRALSELLQHDKRYSYYGRTVGITSTQDGDLDVLAALAKIQGNSNCGTVPENDSKKYCSGLRAKGLVPLVYRKWEGAEDTLAAARRVVTDIPLGDDVSLHCVSSETTVSLLSSAAQMALGCGVLPTCGAALRGMLQPAVTLIAVDRLGEVVSMAAASADVRHSSNFSNDLGITIRRRGCQG